MLNRAYSLLDFKSFDDSERIIEGIASTPSPDRYGDVVDPLGAKFALPMPLLWQHRHGEPVGHVEFASPTKDGIPFRARIAKIEEPGELKDLTDKAWQSVKAQLVRAVSIGFSALEYAFIEKGGIHFKSWEWLELSLVTIPANAEATIQSVKSIDTELRAASGRELLGGSRPTPPGASGTKAIQLIKPKPQEGIVTTQERIAAFEATRQAKAARMQEITEKISAEGRTKDASEREDFDTLRDEVKAIDAELKDLRDMELMQVAKARPVEAKSATEATDSRGTVRVVRSREHSEPGIRFARMVKAIGIAKGLNPHAATIVEERHPDDTALQNVVKAAVAAGTTAHSTWAKPLVGDESQVYADFVEFLRPLTIIGRMGTNGIPGPTRIPFRTPFIGQTSGGEGYWVGEGKAKPLTKFDFNRDTLEPLKVANIAVCTMELLRDSSPSAEVLVRNQLADALAARLDIDFINPAKDPDPGISPASITYNITPISSSGTDADSVREDVRAVMSAFIAANLAPTSAVWVMRQTTALGLSLMVNPLGQPEFPGITMTGGTFFGLPVLTSQHVPAGYVTLINASDIYLGDEGGVEISVSTEASLQMADDPNGNSTGTPQAAQLVSMFQTNSVAFLAERTINWRRRLNRNAGVQLLSGVAWGEVVS